MKTNAPIFSLIQSLDIYKITENYSRVFSEEGLTIERGRGKTGKRPHHVYMCRNIILETIIVTVNIW